MFAGLTAWFSSSVDRNIKKQWVDHDGTEKPLDEAQFIFSEDASAPDTLSVFECEAYLDEHLSVFHPNYITQCVKTGDRSKIVLGEFYFPPADVQLIIHENPPPYRKVSHCMDLWSIGDDNPSNNNVQRGATTQPGQTGQSGTSGNDGLHRRPLRNNASKNTGNPSKTPNKASTNGEPPRKSPRLSASKNSVNSSKTPNKITANDVPARKTLIPNANEITGKSSKTPNETVTRANDGPSENSHRHSASKNTGNSSKTPNKTTTNTGIVSANKPMEPVRNQKQATTQCNNHVGTSKNHAKVSNNRAETRDNRAETRDNRAEGRSNNSNNSEYDRLEDLAFISADLNDFILGKNGCDLVKPS